MLLVSYRKQNKEWGGPVFLFVPKQRTREGTHTHKHTARVSEELTEREKCENSRTTHSRTRLSHPSKHTMSKLLSGTTFNQTLKDKNTNNNSQMLLLLVEKYM